ncbi:MAG TPA: glycosyltransferase [Planctomycetota bacterium]|nr:glycosyltransferase [Planctomycetota bacterium]
MGKFEKPREVAVGRTRAVDARRSIGLDLSIVFATSDDAARIGVSLKRVAAFLERSRISAEVLIVDDGSRDGVQQVVAQWAEHFDRLRLVRNDVRKGLGSAARSGLLLAEGKQVLLAEVGLAAPVEDAIALLDCLAAGADVAIASRKLNGASVRSQRPAGRRAAEAVFGAAARMLVPLGARDLFCGLIAFKRDAARRIAERARLERATFCVEWIALAARMGLQVIECPVRFSHNSDSKDSLSWTDFVRLDDLWKVRSLLNSVRAPMPQPQAKLLIETSFVRLDREALYSVRAPVDGA